MSQFSPPDAPRHLGKIGHNGTWIGKRLIGKIDYVLVDQLKFYGQNPRKHPKRQQIKLDKSVKSFGIVMPVLLDGEGTIIAGEALARSAIRLGYTEIPVIMIDHLEPAEIKALRIALNRLAELSEWDEQKLALEFQDLVEVDFDMELTGFDMAEIDLTLDADLAIVPQSSADAIPELMGPTVSRPGDIWYLDEHIVGCGDARDPVSYHALMASRKAAMVITDPPYNVRIAGNVSGLGTVKHGEFVMASGEMSEAEFETFLEAFVRNVVDFSVPGSVHYLFIDWRHLHVLERVCHRLYAAQLNLCVWVKSNGGMGSMYRSQQELCLVFKNGTAQHINNIQLGRFGRNRSNVWAYQGCNSPSKDRRADLALHPTVKPVEMIADAIRDASNRGDLVLDPFLGSGTAVIACEMTGRMCAGLELDPMYVDVIVRRWQAFTGNRAVHAGTGLSFDEMAEIRSGRQLLLPAPKTGEEG